MKKPFFTVVIPTYNHANFLKRSLKSVLNQSFQDFEILVIDNCSTDNTEEVISSFKSSKIFLYKIENKGVIGASRNLGIQNAKADWISFLDSDDFWYPSKLKTIHKKLNLGSLCDVISNDEIINYSGETNKKKLLYGPLLKNTYSDLLIYGNRLSPSATTVRKKFLYQNKIMFSERVDFVTVEDYDFWLQLSAARAKFKFIHRYEGEYSVHASNNSKRLDIHRSNNLTMLRHHIYNIQEFTSNKSKLWLRVQFRLLLKDSLGKLRTDKSIDTFKEIFTLLALNPVTSLLYLSKRVRNKFINNLLFFGESYFHKGDE